MNLENLTQKEIENLKNNKNILRFNKSITYTSDFKRKAIQGYLKGRSSSDIFIDNGFDLKVIDKKTPSACIHRWLKIYNILKDKAFKNDARGKHSWKKNKTNEELVIENQLLKATIKHIR